MIQLCLLSFRQSLWHCLYLVNKLLHAQDCVFLLIQIAYTNYSFFTKLMIIYLHVGLASTCTSCMQRIHMDKWLEAVHEN